MADTATGDEDREEFPWHLGVFDAHCHPTDTLASLRNIPQMRARVLTIMATRAQDQELVANAAEEYGVVEQKDLDDGADAPKWRKEQKVIPAFGWHPWFSHQMFDETSYSGASELSIEQKLQHYRTVLTPAPEDPTFLHSLPDPRPFGHFLGQMEQYLDNYPLALVGEVGLDRSFRIPEAWLPGEAETKRDDALTPGGREGRRLSPYRVDMGHQRRVLLAQLRLAGKKQRAVSVHGVQAHGIVYETLAESWKGFERRVLSKKEKKRESAAVKINAAPQTADADEEGGGHADPTSSGSLPESKPYPPRICLHSFSGPAETVKQYIAPSVPCEIFFSFSTTINNWADDGNGKVEAAVKAVPDDRIVIESDLHTAGDKMDQYLEEAVRRICRVKSWGLEDGVRQLRSNWRAFVFGG